MFLSSRVAAALRALRTNIAACKAADRTEVLAVDALAVPRAARTASVAFSGPALWAGSGAPGAGPLREVGRIGPGTLIVAETGRDESWVPDQEVLAERQYGAARVVVFRVL